MSFLSLGILLICASIAAAAEPGNLVGEWTNIDQKTIGITRIQISNAGKDWKLRYWAISDEKSLDQGEAPLALLGDFVVCPKCRGATMTVVQDLVESKNRRLTTTVTPQPALNYGFAHWDYKFKDTYLTLTRDNGNLVVDDYNVFKDDSERTNYRLHYVFKRSK